MKTKYKAPSEWYRMARKAIQESDYGYAISWHMRLEWDIPTATINYHLNKLVNQGFLTKMVDCYGTRYFLTDRNLLTELNHQHDPLQTEPRD